MFFLKRENKLEEEEEEERGLAEEKQAEGRHSRSENAPHPPQSYWSSQLEVRTQLVKLTPDSAVHTLRGIKLGVPGTERRDGEYSGFMESGERNFSAELTVMW